MTKKLALVAVAAFALSIAAPQGAHAQETQDVNRTIDASPKGTIGLGLAGANVGLIVASAAGLNQWWALTLFPVVGATGGALAGYFAIDDKGREKAAVGVLAGGLALTIPAVIMTVKAVRYDPDRDYESPSRMEISEAKRKRDQEVMDVLRAGGGLIKKSASGMRFGVPAFNLRAPRLSTDARPSALPEARLRGMHLSIASGVF